MRAASGQLSLAVHTDLERLRIAAQILGDLILHLPDGSSVSTYSALFGGAVLALEAEKWSAIVKTFQNDDNNNNIGEDELEPKVAKEVWVNEKDMDMVEGTMKGLYSLSALSKLYHHHLIPLKPNSEEPFALDSMIRPDFTINLLTPMGNKIVASYEVHKFLLQARVPYYSTLFASVFKDAGTNVSELFTDDIEPKAMEAVIKFLYGVEIEVEGVTLSEEGRKKGQKKELEDRMIEDDTTKLNKNPKAAVATETVTIETASQLKQQTTESKKTTPKKKTLALMASAATKKSSSATSSQRNTGITKPGNRNDVPAATALGTITFLLSVAAAAEYLNIASLHSWCYATLRSKLLHNIRCDCKSCQHTLPHALSQLTTRVGEDKSSLELREDILFWLSRPENILPLWKRPLIVLPEKVHNLLLETITFCWCTRDDPSGPLYFIDWTRSRTSLYVWLSSLSTRIANSTTEKLWHSRLIDPAMAHCVTVIGENFDVAYQAIQWRMMLLSLSFEGEWMETLLFDKLIPSMNGKNCRAIFAGLVKLRSAAMRWLKWDNDSVEDGAVAIMSGEKERSGTAEAILESAIKKAVEWFRKRWVTLAVTTVKGGKGFFEDWAGQGLDEKEIVDELALMLGVDSEELGVKGKELVGRKSA